MGLEVPVPMPDGTSAPGIELTYEMENDPWIIVKLEDGTVLRIKVEISKMYRLNQHNPQTGEPIYHFLSTNIVRTTNVSLALREKGKAAATSSDPRGLYG